MELSRGTSFEQDASLVVGHQQGDKEAFAQLMRTHLPWVYGLCRRVSVHEAEDLCQEIFLQAYRNLSKLRHPQAFVAWLRKLAWHHCQKKGSMARHLEVIDEAEAPSNPWNDFVDGLELGWAFDQLPLGQRQVVVLSLVYGFQEKEISRMLGIPYGTVKSRLHNARRTLQTLLVQTEGDMNVDVRERIIKEVDSRIQEFNDTIVKPSTEDPERISLLEGNARKWHALRQDDAENNARIYGIQLAETGPRMTKEKIMWGTLSRDGITRQVMGVPESANYMDIRDASRRLLVSPFTLLKWMRQGMPTVKYHPWKWLDLDLIKRWLADNGIDLPKEISVDDMDDDVRFVLTEVQAGRASIDDAVEILDSF